MNGNGNERLGVLENRTATIEERQDNIATALNKHVSGCEAMQKRVLIIGCCTLGCCTLGWIIAHSPEVGKAALRLFEVVAP